MRQSTFEDTIYDYLSNLTTGDIIWSDENGTRPTLPYLTLLVSPGIKQGNPHYSKGETIRVLNSLTTTEGDNIILLSGDNLVVEQFDTVVNQSYTYHVDYQVSVQGYGRGSIDLLEDIQEGLHSQTTIEQNQILGIGLRDDTEILDVSTLVGNTREKRYSLTLMFGTIRKVTKQISYVETISGTGTVDDININI